MEVKKIPERKEVDLKFTWNLDKLFPSEQAWEKAFLDFTSTMGEMEGYKGRLGESVATFAKAVEILHDLSLKAERLSVYAHLKLAEEVSSSDNQRRVSQISSALTNWETLASFFNPELQALPEETIQAYLKDPAVKPYEIKLQKILRYKPHVLSPQEERLLALQSSANETAQNTFSALTNADFDFGSLETPQGPRPLSNATFASFMLSQDRDLREKAYKKFYGVFSAHKNTLASLYQGSIHLDIYKARARNFPSSRAAALFPDKVPEKVYYNLVSAVRENLPHLHRYYSLRKRTLEVKDLRHYDVYVPLIRNVETRFTFEEAAETVRKALSPLGDEYCSTLYQGLLGGWVDRYENKGKRAGAFSWGAYGSDPYILMNYQEEVLRDLFTLAHEGGHSMHSYYSMKSNPYQHYDYTIFEAEVASTFNEQLLADYLMKNTEDPGFQKYLLGKLVDDAIATIFRQTMFAEFELNCHTLAEKGEPLSLEILREEYRKLLKDYFGPEMVLEEESDLEGLRIPHFYTPFYVYKYATGLSAAISLSRQVLEGGKAERDRYLAFLCSGGSKYPLESLALAGVDMEKEEPVNRALEYFGTLVDKLSES